MECTIMSDAGLRHIADMHSAWMARADYPCPLSVETLREHDGGTFWFPTPSCPTAFFLLDDKPSLPGLGYPVIKHLTVFDEVDAIDIPHFISFLKNLGGRFLAMVESFNAGAISLLERLPHQPTYFCQQKLLCRNNRLGQMCMPAPHSVSIRNFVTGEDEVRYATFYNQVLGALAGKPVDRSFVDGIVARPSFDPHGYFLAESQGEMVGFLSIEKEPWGEQGSGFGYIFQIGVVDKWQGTGLADILLHKSHAFALQEQISRIGVGVRKSNSKAVNFFRNHGFQAVYEVTGYFIDLS